MSYFAYTVERIRQLSDDTFELTVKPKEDTSIFPFRPGQFCGISFSDENRVKRHFFSIASSPTRNDHLAFCFRVYGEWTRKLSEQKPDQTVLVEGPFGKFTWDSSEKNPALQSAVFLAGGVGITPFLSILSYIIDTKQKPSITLLYGSQTKDTILYRNEVEQMIASLPKSKVIHVLSDVAKTDTWQGHKGFITKEILRKEIDFSKKPKFFLCGPPVFVQLMNKLLEEFGIEKDYIYQELFSV